HDGAERACDGGPTLVDESRMLDRAQRSHSDVDRHPVIAHALEVVVVRPERHRFEREDPQLLLEDEAHPQPRPVTALREHEGWVYGFRRPPARVVTQALIRYEVAERIGADRLSSR